MGMGQPPMRWTSLEKKTSAKPSMVSKRLNVTWVSGVALLLGRCNLCFGLQQDGFWKGREQSLEDWLEMSRGAWWMYDLL